MLKKILLGLGALVGVFAIIVAVQPAEYHVERSTTIEAPAEIVWAEFSNFAHWKKWSHWDKSDPEQKTTITGEPGTVGHKTVWDGEKTGKGSMEITEATPHTSLKIDLAFFEPMASEAVTDFAMTSEGDSVTITWSMDGQNGFVGKFFTLIMGGMDGMIGDAYEEGLANLKQISEENARAAEAAAEAAAEVPAEVPAEAPAEAPAEEPAEAPAE